MVFDVNILLDCDRLSFFLGQCIIPVGILSYVIVECCYLVVIFGRISPHSTDRPVPIALQIHLAHFALDRGSLLLPALAMFRGAIARMAYQLSQEVAGSTGQINRRAGLPTLHVRCLDRAERLIGHAG
jgi:hypothetical protein